MPVPTDNLPPDTAASADAPSGAGENPEAASSGGHVTTGHGVVARARADLQHGRAWKARDRLAGHLADHRDGEALDLLGQIHYDMGDLPAAGAVWFGSTRRGAEVEEAVSAWRERHGDDFGQMWRSLPRSLRAQPRTPKLEALRSKAIDQDRRAGRVYREPDRPSLQTHVPEAVGGLDAAMVIAWVLAAAFVACGVVGVVTVLHWVVR